MVDYGSYKNSLTLPVIHVENQGPARQGCFVKQMKTIFRLR
jgi:hypothetical protein